MSHSTRMFETFDRAAMPAVIFGGGGASGADVPVRSLRSLPSHASVATDVGTAEDLRSAHMRLTKLRDSAGLADAKGSHMRTLPDRVHAFVDDIEQNYFLYRKPSRVWNWVGMAAGAISLVALCFQIAIIVEHRTARDLSWGFIVGSLVVQFLWIIYSFGNRLRLHGLFALVAFAGVAAIMVMKFMFDDSDAAHLEAATT